MNKWYIRFKIIFTQKKYSILKLIIGFIFIKLNLSKYIVIKKCSYKLRFFSLIGIKYNFYNIYNNSFGDNKVEFLKKLLKTHSIIIDIGANFGDLSLPIAKFIGLQGKVITIKSHPTTFKYLQENITFNNISNIILYNNITTL